MKKIYKSAAVVVLLAFLTLSCYAAPVNFNTDALDMYSDTELETFDDSVEIFKRLQIFNTTEDIQSIVTRSQFVSLLLRFFDLDSIIDPNSAKGIYNDLDENNQKIHEIEYAVENGFIDAYSHDKFRPNDYLLFEEAVKALITGLGYDQIIEIESGKGRFDSLFMTKAKKIGLLDDVKISQGCPIVYGNLMTIFKNALTVRLVDYSFSNNNPRYFISDNKTVLNTIHKFEMRKGIVTGTQYTDIQSGGETASDSIKIDHTIYHYAGISADIIGQRVEYYVTHDKNIENLKYIKSIQEEDDFFSISDEEIINFQNRKYEYYDKNSKRKTIRIPTGCIVIYNGRAVTNSFDMGSIKFKPDIGSVTFIDNNDDNVYDICKIESFENLLVGSINKEKKEFFDKFNQQKYISLSEINDSMVFIENLSGDRITADKIKLGQVISIAKSADGELVKIIVSNKSISGVIDSIVKDKLVINNKEYEIEHNNNQSFRVGKMGIFSLDKDERVVYFEEATDVITGYVIDAVLDTSGFSETLKMKVLNASGNIEIFNASKTIYINDIKKTNHHEAFNLVADCAPGVFTYTINGNGEICKIYTLYNGIEKLCPSERLQQNSQITDSGITYTSWPMSFKDSRTFFDGNTVFFCVPENPQHASIDDFSVCTAASLQNDGIYCSVENPLTTYKLGGDSLVANCVVMNNSYLINDYRIGVVCDFQDSLDEQGEVCTQIGIFNYGSNDLYYLYDDVGINTSALAAASVSCSTDVYELTVGDIVLYGYTEKNGKRLIEQLKILYDVNTGKYLYKNPPSTTAASTSTYYFGDVYEKSGKYISVVLSGGELTGASSAVICNNFDKTQDNYFVEHIGNSNILKLSSNDRYSEVIIDSSAEEIIPYCSSSTDYSKVFVFTGRGDAIFCYIVK